MCRKATVLKAERVITRAEIRVRLKGKKSLQKNFPCKNNFFGRGHSHYVPQQLLKVSTLMGLAM